MKDRVPCSLDTVARVEGLPALQLQRQYPLVTLSGAL